MTPVSLALLPFGDNAACRNQSHCDTKLIGKAMVDPEFGDTRLVGTSHAVTQNSSERIGWIQNSEIHGLSETVTL